MPTRAELNLKKLNKKTLQKGVNINKQKPGESDFVQQPVIKQPNKPDTEFRFFGVSQPAKQKDYMDPGSAEWIGSRKPGEMPKGDMDTVVHSRDLPKAPVLPGAPGKKGPTPVAPGTIKQDPRYQKYTIGRPGDVIQERPSPDMSEGFRKTIDQIYQVADPRERQKQLAEYYKDKGIRLDPEQMPTSFEQELDELVKAQELESTRLERELGRQEKTAKEQFEASKSAVSAAFGQDREGAVSYARAQFPKEFIGRTTEQLGSQLNQINMQREKIKNLEKAQQRDWVAGRDDQIMRARERLSEMQAQNQAFVQENRQQTMDMISMLSDNEAFATMDPMAVEQLAMQTPELSGVVRGIAQAQRDKALTDVQQRQFDTLESFKGLVADGTPLSDNALIQISQQSRLPLDALISFNNRAKEIQASKGLDDAQKALELEKLGFELDREARGVVNKDLEKVDYMKQQIQRLRDQGLPQEALDAAMTELTGMLGLDSSYNPKYQAEVKLAQAEAELKSMEAMGIVIPGSKDYYDIEDKKVKIKQQRAELENYMTFGAQKEMYETALKEAEFRIKDKQSRGEAVSIQDKMDLLDYNSKLQSLSENTVYMPTNSLTGLQASIVDNQLEVTVPPNKEYQCGAFVNRLWGVPSGGSGMGNTYASKQAIVNRNGIKSQDITNPYAQIKPGMAFVMPLGGRYSGIGHTGIVKSVNPDGTFTTIEANADGGARTSSVGPGKNNITSRTLSIDQMYGFAYPPEDKSEQIVTQPAGKRTNVFADDPIKEQSFIKDIRKEWNSLPLSKSAQEALSGKKRFDSTYKRAMEVLQGEDGTVAGPAVDALIVQFNKMLDPGSVVREGEFARTEESVPLMKKLEQYQAQFTEGSRVPVDIIKEIKETVDRFEGGYKTDIKSSAQPYLNQMEYAGLSEDAKNQIFSQEVLDVFTEPSKEDIRTTGMMGISPIDVQSFDDAYNLYQGMDYQLDDEFLNLLNSL